jgi:hypothetical protein
VTHGWRLALIAAFGLAASACSNQVISETPWFAPGGENQITAFSNGLWLRVAGPNDTVSPLGEVRVRADGECRFNRNRPVARWPDCAEWHVVRGDQMLDYQLTGETDRYAWHAFEPVIAAGSPMILQFGECPVAESDLTGQPVVGRDEDMRMAFCYRALEPVARYAEGLITSYARWPIYCGPLAEDSETGVTATPWPGLTVRGRMCFADDEAALRNAARLSRALAEENGRVERFEWVRAGYQ